MGPGAVGTGTWLGTTALEVGPVLDAVAALDGVGVLCVRASSGDARARHQGISHHTSTAVVHFTHEAFLLPVPAADVGLTGLVDLRHTGAAEEVVVDVPDVGAMLERRGLRITTMGRGPAEDPLAFRFAAAAGIVAGRRVVGA